LIGCIWIFVSHSTLALEEAACTAAAATYRNAVVGLWRVSENVYTYFKDLAIHRRNTGVFASIIFNEMKRKKRYVTTV